MKPNSHLSTLNSQLGPSLNPGLVPCPGLKLNANAGATWTDSRGRVHDLETTKTLDLAQAADDPRLSDLGFGTERAVSTLILRGYLYPVYRKNSRVLKIFDPALADFKARRLAAQCS